MTQRSNCMQELAMMSIELLIVIKITTSMAAIATELSKICRLPELGNKECQAFWTDFCQKEAFNAGS